MDKIMRDFNKLVHFHTSVVFLLFSLDILSLCMVTLGSQNLSPCDFFPLGYFQKLSVPISSPNVRSFKEGNNPGSFCYPT